MRNDMKKRLEKLNRVPLYIMQKRKINKLEREIESLQETNANAPKSTKHAKVLWLYRIL